MPSLVEILRRFLNFFNFPISNLPISLLATLGREQGPSFERTWMPFIQGCFVPSFVEIGPVRRKRLPWEEDFVNVLLLFCNYLPLEKGVGSSFKLLQWEEEVFLEKKTLSMYYCYFVIISPWKRAWALPLNKLEFPSPRDALCQVWLKLAQWFWRSKFL